MMLRIWSGTVLNAAVAKSCSARSSNKVHSALHPAKEVRG